MTPVFCGMHESVFFYMCYYPVSRTCWLKKRSYQIGRFRDVQLYVLSVWLYLCLLGALATKYRRLLRHPPTSMGRLGYLFFLKIRWCSYQYYRSPSLTEVALVYNIIMQARYLQYFLFRSYNWLHFMELFDGLLHVIIFTRRCIYEKRGHLWVWSLHYMVTSLRGHFITWSPLCVVTSLYGHLDTLTSLLCSCGCLSYVMIQLWRRRRRTSSPCSRPSDAKVSV